jgi:hypothetical protein
LEEFARWADPQGSKLLVVLVDNVGWHLAKRLEVPPNVVLHRLPQCTPELTADRATLAAGAGGGGQRRVRRPGGDAGPVVDRCRWLIDHADVVRVAVGFE